MRQNYKDIEYYKRYISEMETIEKRSINRHKLGQIPQDRLQPFFDFFRENALIKTKLKYTFGESIEEVKKEFENVINYAYENWVGLWTLKISEEKILKQYTLSGYDEMVAMLSLAYLLEVPENDFRKLVNLVDQDGIKDFLLEFIIRAKLKDRQPILEESYQKYFGVPKVFERLRQVITEKDKPTAEKQVKEYITKEWYKNHRGQGWYNCHKSVHDVYYGYWSFETAAVVKIMSLDDSSFLNCQYYPKDLVHQNV